MVLKYIVTCTKGAIVMDKKLHQNKEWLEDQYKKHGTSTIAKMVNRDDKTIIYWLKKFEIPIRTRSETLTITDNRKNSINRDFFKTVDSEIKAYLLGFLMADANMKERVLKTGTVRHTLDLTVHKQDIEVLELFKKQTNCSSEIKNKSENGRRIYISDYEFCKNLRNLGVTPNKTGQEKFPEMPQYFKKHFVRGYFDGDGCIVWSKNGRLRGKFHIVSGYGILCSIKEFLESEGVRFTNKSLHEKKGANAYELEISTLPEVAKIYDILYLDSNYFLKRKRQSFDEFINYYLLTPRASKRYSPTLRGNS